MTAANTASQYYHQQQQPSAHFYSPGNSDSDDMMMMDTSSSTTPCHHEPPRLNKKSVSFSQYSQVHLLFGDNDPTSSSSASTAAWHTPKEQQGFVTQMVHDSRRLLNILQTTAPQDISQDTLAECVGIEQLLNPQGPGNVLESRRTHLNSVLMNQRSCSPEDLRAMSEVMTEGARERAHQLALAYSRQG